MVAPIQISTSEHQYSMDTPTPSLAPSPSLQRVSSLRRVNSHSRDIIVGTPVTSTSSSSPLWMNNNIDSNSSMISSTPLSISTEYVGGGRGHNTYNSTSTRANHVQQQQQQAFSPPRSVPKVNSGSGLRWTNSSSSGGAAGAGLSSPMKSPPRSPPLIPKSNSMRRTPLPPQSISSIAYNNNSNSVQPSSSPVRGASTTTSINIKQRHIQSNNVNNVNPTMQNSSMTSSSPSRQQHQHQHQHQPPTTTITKPSSSSSLALPIALTAVKSFGDAFAACGAEEFLQLPSRGNGNNEPGVAAPLEQQQQHPPQLTINMARSTSSLNLSMKDSGIVNNRSMMDDNNNGQRQHQQQQVNSYNGNGSYVASSPTISTPTQPQVNYDTNPTQLYLSIQNKQWEAVIQRSWTHVHEVSTWVYRTEANGTSLRWKLLPLHAAIVFEAPARVISALINNGNDDNNGTTTTTTTMNMAMCPDDQGKLPIHLCFRRDTTSPEVLRLLLEAYPQSINVKDDKGREPIVLAMHSRSNLREGWLGVLTRFQKEMEDGGGGDGVEEVQQQPMRQEHLSIKPSSSYALDKLVVTTGVPSTAPASCNSERRPLSTRGVSPTTKTVTNAAAKKKVGEASSRQSGGGMDSELMQKLNRRREKMNQVASKEGASSDPGLSLPKRNEDDLSLPKRNVDDQVSEEGVEIEYTDGSNGEMVIDVSPSKQPCNEKEAKAAEENDDAALLQQFHSRQQQQRVNKRDNGLTSNNKSPSRLSINCKEEEQSKIPTESSTGNGDGTYRRSIVDMAPPSLRAQMRDRMERKKNGLPSTTQKKVSSFKDLHTSSGNTVASSSGHISISSSICSSVDEEENTTTKPVASLNDFLHKRSSFEGLGNQRGVAAMMTTPPCCDESISIASSICNSSTDGRSISSNSIGGSGSIGQYFSLKRANAWECTLETTSEGNEESTPQKQGVIPDIMLSSPIPSEADNSESEKLDDVSPSSETTPKKKNIKPTTQSNDLIHSVKPRKWESSALASKHMEYGKFSRYDEHEQQDYQDEEVPIERRLSALAAPERRGAGRLSSKITKDHQQQQYNATGWVGKDKNEPELYASTSLMTASTAEITEIPSDSYEDGSLSETYTSRSRMRQAKSEEASFVHQLALSTDEQLNDDGQENDDDIDIEDLSTPNLLKRLDKFRSKSFFSSNVEQEDSLKDDGDTMNNDLDTPNLMKQAGRFFSNDEDSRQNVSTPASPISRPESVLNSPSPTSSVTMSKFDLIMAKYESMALSKDARSSTAQRNDTRQEMPCTEADDHTESYLVSISPRQDSYACVNDDIDLCSIPSVPSIKRGASKSRYSNSWEYSSSSAEERIEDININNTLPQRAVLRQANIFNPPPVSGIRLQLTQSQDSADGAESECFMTIPQVGSMESDAVSTLSRTTGYSTVGAISINTENSAVIEAYVQSIVHNIVAAEVDNGSSLKKELEIALKSKMKLEARVKKLLKQSDDKSVELRKAREEKQMAKEVFGREMDVHLARKAAELQNCIGMAFNQAEQSKQRALELAQRDMEEEVALLRSQLDTVSEKGVQVDSDLQRALELVESNQRALREAAENDVKSALDMKKEIEQSFVSAVGEFEAWSDKQVSIMEARWEGRQMN